MTGKVKHTGTLLYYDGIQVFSARDAIGGNFVGLQLDRGDGGEYVLIGVSPSSLQDFRLGRVDLASIMTEFASDGWFVGELVRDDSGLVFVPGGGAKTDSIPGEFLPDAGLTLVSAPISDAVLVRKEAVSRDTFAMELAIESRVPSEDHRIGMNVLANALARVQSLVKNAYRSALSGISRAADREVPSMLDVVATPPGSFGVLLVPSNEIDKDLFGESEVSKALEVVDYLLSDTVNPESTLEHVRKYAGHTARSFVQLLKFMSEDGVSLGYSWTTPKHAKVTARNLARNSAEPLLGVLSAHENLQVEKVTLAGKLIRCDHVAGTWKMRDAEDDREYSGKSRAGVNLKGLVMDGSYVFNCEEETEEIAGTGREVRTLYLTRKPRKPQ